MSQGNVIIILFILFSSTVFASGNQSNSSSTPAVVPTPVPTPRPTPPPVQQPTTQQEEKPNYKVIRANKFGTSDPDISRFKKGGSGAGKLDKETLTEMERIRKEPRISRDFARGEFLIYDCRTRNYACVNITSFAYCRKLRDDGYVQKKNILPCAPLKEFADQETCFKEHYKLMHKISAKPFCQNTKNAKY